MKKIFILGLAILIFLSGCKNPITATSSEQSPSFLSDFADTAQTIVSALNDQSSEFTGSDSSESNSHNISDPTSQTNSSDNHNETSTSTNSSATDGATTGDFEYHNARTESIYPRRVHFTPIKTYEKRYYKNLDVKTQEVYRIIDNAVYQMQTGYIDLGRCTYAQVVLAYDSVRHDRPEYYWMPSAYLCNDYNSVNMKLGLGIESTPATFYLCTKSERALYDSKIKSALENLNINLNSGMNEYERELAVHDWLVNRVTYDFSVAEEYQENGTTTKNKFAFSSLGALVTDEATASAVCEGYSRALQLALNFVGLECGIVNGKYGNGSHMWNVVKINNCWYHVDATSNDTSDKGFHLFLNTSTAFILNTHTIDVDYSVIDPSDDYISFNYNLPECNSMDFNYIIMNASMLSDKSQMNSIVIASLINSANSGKSYCEFVFSADSAYYFTKDPNSEICLTKLINLNYCVNTANNSLSKDHKISSIIYTSITGWKGFLLYW